MLKQLLTQKPTLFTHNISHCDTLFETIKSQNYKIFNLQYHQNRVNRSYNELYNSKPKLDLSKIIEPTKELNRVKIVYNQHGLVDVSYYIYRKKPIKKVKLIEIADFEYNYKYLNRDFFDALYIEYQDIDEFILTKKGYITDSTIANLAFLDKRTNKWHTPQNPLLKGTTRERLLIEKKLILKQIDYTKLKNYSRIAFLNAMIEFRVID